MYVFQIDGQYNIKANLDNDAILIPLLMIYTLLLLQIFAVLIAIKSSYNYSYYYEE